MYILTAAQFKEWDQFTISHEPVTSIDLMERAARQCAEWIQRQSWQEKSFSIFCGKGNNGGDGLAIARMLLQQGYKVSVYILEFGHPGSTDFQANLTRLHEMPLVNLSFIQSESHFPLLSSGGVIIDALFGYGLNKPLEGITAQLVDHINRSGALVVSIDLPSGMFADRSSAGNMMVQADFTLSFESYKTALLVQENALFTGEVVILPIGLHPDFLEKKDLNVQLLTAAFARQVYRPRNRFAHKGNFGHALLVAGSYGKMGAAVLAARAIVHAGAGLLTCYIPRCGYDIMQTAVPEAMVLTDQEEAILSQLPEGIEKYTAIGVGPGMGTADASCKVISFMVRRYTKPLVIDADGLNCIAQQPALLQQLPPFSIITPHPREFDRLFGSQENDFDRIQTAREQARKLQLVIVLKGHHTFIAMPGGSAWFNSTGNPGMAKGGSGDVLTGIITALLAQSYEPVAAALLGVYLHGLSGDLAAKALSEETMSPSDLIHHLSMAFRELQTGVE